MRGGFRSGAGRPGREVKIEDCLRLSVRCLQASGLLAKPWTGQWAWQAPANEKMQSIIEISTTADAVYLFFASHGRSVKQVLMLSQVPNTFGGYRIYFICPRCSSRRREVYFLDGIFLCRGCHALPYQSQSEGSIDRAWRAERKIELKLDPLRRKPKGMHKTTFQYLLAKLFDLECQRESDICALFNSDDL
jgi:hypothetical protein